MVKHKKLGMAVAGAFALCGASAAHAFNVKAGDWDLSMSGEVNAFYSFTHCDNNANAIKSVGPNAACIPAGGPQPGGANRFSSIESGLLPSALVFSAKTTQEGFDIGVTFGFYPGLNNGGQVSGANTDRTLVGHHTVPGANNNGALGSTGIDMRQNFLTFGDKEMGTVKMGRDLGLFGSDAILSDMTLLGVGSVQGPGAPGNTTLGRIGIGYIYADWLPQITYITPSWDGLQVSAGIFQPLDMLSADGGFLSSHSMPMFQSKATWDYDVMDIKGRVWVGGLIQRAMADNLNGQPNNLGVTAMAGEVGIKGNVYGFEPVIYYYQGRGAGLQGLFWDGFAANGQKRNSNGGYIQMGHSFGKWRPSFSYGLSRLATAAGEVNPTLINFNRSRVQMLQYSLTKSLTLVEEFTTSTTSNQGQGVGNKNQSTNISLGAILFF